MLGLVLGTLPAAAEAPLSAIDWLSPSVATPGHPGAGSMWRMTPMPGEAPVGPGSAIEDISVVALDRPDPEAAGLVPVARSGLPRGLWGVTPEPELAALMRKERLDTLPAIRDLLQLLMLAELDPPKIRAQGADRVAGSLFLARVDRLLDLGALEPAFALLEQAGPADPERLRRLFDIALLLGEEDRACAMMSRTPGIAPAPPARIYCLARAGDWGAAELALTTGRGLGAFDPATELLLEHFLDPELAEEGGDLPFPERPSPLTFRMMEAIGQPLATTGLPVAFAQADLRANTGWKARIEAAERLARLGSIDANQVLGLYTERAAAASGGVWDRVAAVAALDQALTAGDAAAVARALPPAHDAMKRIDLLPYLAALYAPQLTALALPPEAAGLAFRLGLLSERYETVARDHRPADPTEAFLIGLAQGNTAGLEPPDARAAALKAVFDSPALIVTERYAALMSEDRLGEALLRAAEDVTDGARGDDRRIAFGLTVLRAAGLERVARRAALELMLLERRG